MNLNTSDPAPFPIDPGPSQTPSIPMRRRLLWIDNVLLSCNPLLRVFTVCIPRRPTSSRRSDTQRILSKLNGTESLLSDSSVQSFNSVPLTSERQNVQKNSIEAFNYGSIHLKLEYDFAGNKLGVTIVECQDLPAMDRNGMSDPYVKMTLLPDRKPKFETKIKRNSLNPVFDETFLFSLNFNELQRKTLQIVVFDFDRLSKDDRIGQLSIHLDTVDFGDVTDRFMYLEQPENESESIGGLVFFDEIPTSYQHFDSNYHGSPELEENGHGRFFRVHMVISVWDYDKMSKNDFIGEVVLSSPNLNMSSCSLASHEQWSEMMLTRRPVVKWHTLQGRDKE